MQLLQSIRLAGWKSIKEQTLELNALTVVIGANGAGKSNLLSLFKLMNQMFAKTPGFRNYVAQNGFAESLLHYGSKRTPVAELELKFGSETGEVNTYYARWGAGAAGMLIFLEERATYLQPEKAKEFRIDLDAGHIESHLLETADFGDKTAKTALWLVRACRLFHFHDTSPTCAARQPCYVEANRFLAPDAGNLAAMLYLFREKHPIAYRRIEATVRQMVPDFAGFVLEPSELNDKSILLKWMAKDR
ncbi:MAG: AAA family ATPase, partial [Gemmataceae bacterium]